MLTIALPPETETRLQVEALRQGVEVADYVKKLIENALPKPEVDQATLDLLDRWDREQATDDPEEISRRQAEVKEFMESMNRNRLEMEGPNASRVYP
jgi:predicted DNA-binding protein